MRHTFAELELDRSEIDAMSEKEYRMLMGHLMGLLWVRHNDLGRGKEQQCYRVYELRERLKLLSCDTVLAMIEDAPTFGFSTWIVKTPDHSILNALVPWLGFVDEEKPAKQEEAPAYNPYAPVALAELEDA